MRAQCWGKIKKKKNKCTVQSSLGHSANGNGWKECKALCIGSKKKKKSEAGTLTERRFALAVFKITCKKYKIIVSLF